jgi:branched-chain amino acid transport system substrate-binding protein
VRGLVVAAALAVAAAAPARAHAQVIYSSLPLTGAAAEQTREALDGERLALAESGVPVTLRSLNDATRAAGNWDPGKVASDARRAAEDPNTIAYIGEFNSGASAISIPILNEAGIPQVSPSNTYPGLTRDGPGTTRGEPDKYYPAGERTYVRVAPPDHLQAAAIAALLAREGAKSVALAHDRDVYGSGMSTLVATAARARGIRVTLQALLRRPRNAATVARRVRASHPDAFVFTGVTANGCPQLLRAVHHVLRRVPLITSDGCAESGTTRRVGSGAAARMLMTIAIEPASALGPAGRAFASRFRARFRRSPGDYGAFGYEAMALALDAIARAGGPSAAHADVVHQLFATRDRDSVLGRYSIDPFGDTTLSTYGVYRVRSRVPAFAFAIDSAAP